MLLRLGSLYVGIILRFPLFACFRSMDFTLFKFIVISTAVVLSNAAAVPPHQDVARMARYIVHNSGELFIIT